jgi:hypothetical protein
VNAQRGIGSTAIHEAGHAVILMRLGGRVRFVDIIPTPSGSRDGKCGAEVPLDKPVAYLFSSLYAAAGHFAEFKWANGARLGSWMDGSGDDFRNISERFRDRRKAVEYRSERGTLRYRRPRISKEDKNAAMKVWRNAMRRLNHMVTKDPSIQVEVMAVAAALEEKKRLAGHEVEAIVALTKYSS